MNRLSNQELHRIKSLSDATLLAEFQTRARSVANDVTWLAAAIEELANRQSDIADLASDICKSGFWLYLPLVASGQVSALAVASFCTREKLLAIIAQLPVSEQERFSSQMARIEVEFFNPLFGKPGQSEFDSRMYLPFLLPDSLFPQVFDSEARTVRDKQAQRAYLHNHRPKGPAAKSVRVPTLRIDANNMLLFVDNRPVRISALADAIALMAVDHPEVEKAFKRAFRARTSPVRK